MVLILTELHNYNRTAPLHKLCPDIVPVVHLVPSLDIVLLLYVRAHQEKRVLQASLDDSSSSPDLGAKHARRTSTPTAMQFRSAETSVNESTERNGPASTAVVLTKSSGSSCMSAAALEPLPHTDMGQQPLRELVKLVQHHKQHLLVHGAHPVALVRWHSCGK